MAIKDKDIQDDYIINLSGSVDTEFEGTPSDNGFVPFRFKAVGPFNLRSQSASGYYKTFLGEQKS